MSIRTLWIGATVAIGLVLGGWWFYRTHFAIMRINYMGEAFELPASYLSYERYRNDPDNLGAANVARIRQLAESTLIPKRFADQRQLSLAVMALKFPGYGAETLRVDAETQHALTSIEMPGAARHRYWLWRSGADGIEIIDDFVLDGPEITKTVVRDRQAIYHANERVVRTWPVPDTSSVTGLN